MVERINNFFCESSKKFGRVIKKKILIEKKGYGQTNFKRCIIEQQICSYLDEISPRSEFAPNMLQKRGSQNKFLLSASIFKLAFRCESCRVLKIDWALETLLKTL